MRVSSQILETLSSGLYSSDENAFKELISLVDQRALFFVKASRLEDPYEGSVPEKTQLARFLIYARGTHRFQNSNQVKEFFRPFELMKAVYNRYKEIVLINSWYLSEDESTTMWDSHSQRGAESLFNRHSSDCANLLEKIHVIESGLARCNT